MLIREESIFVSYSTGTEEHDTEGWVITTGFPEYYVVVCCTPNSQGGLTRLDHRMKWGDGLLVYFRKLEKNKPVVFYRDLNVAHEETGLKNPKTNRKNIGFTDGERGKFTDLLAAGFVGTFRYFYPDLKGIYSQWSYRFSARAKNVGWCIDHFCVSEGLKDRLVSTSIHNTVVGSDHCPVELVIE